MGTSFQITYCLMNFVILILRLLISFRQFKESSLRPEERRFLEQKLSDLGQLRRSRILSESFFRPNEFQPRLRT